jgi:ADP-ribose pyrophosphatase YjhB (NUDIX family)
MLKIKSPPQGAFLIIEQVKNLYYGQKRCKIKSLTKRRIQMSADKEQLFNDFIEYYNTLTEKEKFGLAGVFNKATGGKLSPFNSPQPVGVAVIQVQDGDEIKLLGMIRGIPPKVGEIAFPGGFNNTLEVGIVATVRELFEETGLQTKPEDYEYVGELMSPTNNNLLFYMNKNVFPKSIIETLKPDDSCKPESQGFVLIDKDTPMAFPHHRTIADQVLAAVNSYTSKPKMR